MKMGYNPQENSPDLVGDFPTHLNNMLIKIASFPQKFLGVKKTKKWNQPPPGTLGASCYSKHPMGGDFFRHDKLLWSRPQNASCYGVSMNGF